MCVCAREEEEEEESLQVFVLANTINLTTSYSSNINSYYLSAPISKLSSVHNQLGCGTGRGNCLLLRSCLSHAIHKNMMMMFSIGVLVCALSVSSSSGKNFIADPKCPAAQPQASCAGRRSTCWSPGVRDLDCPGHGLCCYDGCANTCVPADSSVPAASVHQPQYTPPLPQTTPRPYRPPPTTTKRPYQRPTTTTKTPYHPPPVNSYVPPAPKPITYPQDNYIPPLASPSQEYGPPPLPPVQQPSHNIEVVRPRPTTSPPTRPHGNGGGSCPRQTPLPPVSCRGRHSTCWSVGVADLDCPNWGLCCFDGCANTCLDSPPAPRQTTTPQPPRNPCEPNPCGPGSMCIPQEGEPQCKCPEGLVPNPTPAQGCIVPNPCDPNPCGPGSMCIPNEGRPTCKCPEGLVPDPRPELRCSEPRRRDPCNPSPCGPGTTCTPNADGNPICRCKAGLIPKPDTITGCGPECIVDPDCGDRALVCRQERCTERPDPCNPSPCGPGTTCRPNRNGDPVCECEAGLIPKPDTITGNPIQLQVT